MKISELNKYIKLRKKLKQTKTSTTSILFKILANLHIYIKYVETKHMHQK